MNIEDMVTFNVNGKKCVAFVRKLTERECFRLMGVDEKDIDTIAASGVSSSAQYKMAGNSIVVDVLCHIFRTAFISSERGAGHDLFGASGLIQGKFTKDNHMAAFPVLEDGRMIDIHIRMLKPEELAAAHSFPSDYILTGNRGQQVKHIGNSVPVMTACAMCEADFREM